ncbi:hypothetical protein Poly30_27760 [Planctomycetes bacterium Poly30]|uniref:GIY-YIG domain-containing protein n=1 Tax=Saltatorellus ferox TaxID=2528018 RepID=A0A518ET42_9BACT|nr:hypothetical protein Poly30_27760 [Planctomycetes bacterium Poly30]
MTLDGLLQMFCDAYWPSGIQRPTWSERFDLRCEEAAKTTWPNADSAGVYALLDESGAVLYIGKASMGASVGGRVFCHVAGGGAKFVAREGFGDVRWLRTVGVEESRRFIAPAIEEFLIDLLQPPLNRAGRNLQ